MVKAMHYGKFTICWTLQNYTLVTGMFISRSVHRCRILTALKLSHTLNNVIQLLVFTNIYYSTGCLAFSYDASLLHLNFFSLIGNKKNMALLISSRKKRNKSRHICCLRKISSSKDYKGHNNQPIFQNAIKHCFQN